MKNCIYIFLLFILLSCNKLVQITPPPNSITTDQTYADSADATSGILGIYTIMSYTNYISVPSGFGNGGISELCALSSDELLLFSSEPELQAINTNTLIATSGITDIAWLQAYSILYQINASLEGLKGATGLSSASVNRLTGEAKWFRAFIYFYLTNLYGDVPLITSSDYRKNQSAPRTPSLQVYDLIVSDLKDAQNLLGTDFAAGGGQRIRVNTWAATAMLARTYLYLQHWDLAETQASAIINNTGLFNLVGLDSIVLANNSEAILQWQLDPTVFAHDGTSEGCGYIPSDNSSSPNYYLSTSLLEGFETNDLRKIHWLDSTNYSGTVYYYPYKYKVGNTFSPGAPATEYSTVLRLAEQYLIRAEARAQLGKLSDAISDLNQIRQRAGLPPLPATLNQTQVLAAVAQERRIELFSEWGHRWLDLKRTNQATPVLSAISYKSAWKPFQQLYPIPVSERQSDPSLTQNPGY